MSRARAGAWVATAVLSVWLGLHAAFALWPPIQPPDALRVAIGAGVGWGFAALLAYRLRAMGRGALLLGFLLSLPVSLVAAQLALGLLMALNGAGDRSPAQQTSATLLRTSGHVREVLLQEGPWRGVTFRVSTADLAGPRDGARVQVRVRTGRLGYPYWENLQ